MILTEQLTKRFGDKAAVLDLNLDIPEGTFFCFLGPNGAGKTTASFTILPDILGCKEFVNADAIAYGILLFPL